MMPGALLVVLVGIVVAIVQYPTVMHALRLGPSIPRIIVPTAAQWKTGATRSHVHGHGSACSFGSRSHPGIPLKSLFP